MKDYADIFKDAQITQMGLGLLGRGVGDADFLARHGVNLTVTDLKDEHELSSSYKKLISYKNITFALGGHNHEDFKGKDLILKGAGVPVANQFIATARKNNVPVDMSASLFMRIANIPVIGVTGTRGKSTVTHLIHEILMAEGRAMVLGGNVKGVSNLALLEQVEKDSMGIFELDSWQCQGFAEERSLDHPAVLQGPHSPSVAVFTTFMPDHLNYYNGDMDAYLKDKVNIFKHQDSAHVLVIGRQALPALTGYKKDMHANVIIADETDMPKSWKTKLSGQHNRYNIGLAVAVTRVLGVEDETIREVVEGFNPISGRLEYVGVVDGVEVYNDTNATTPDAAARALEALGTEDEHRLVLIAGGATKGLDQQIFADAIKKHATHVILLPGEGTEAISEALGETRACTIVETLEAAVAKAFEQAQKGDRILLSPGCASFGMFKNEYDRGEQFIEEIQKYE